LDPDPNLFKCWVSPAEKESGSVLDKSSKMGTCLKSLFSTLGDEIADVMGYFLSYIVHTNSVSDPDSLIPDQDPAFYAEYQSGTGS
jgi:hypothetical protein